MIAHDRSAGAPVETPVAAPMPGGAGGLIEIVLCGAAVRLHGGVDAKTLATVLRAMKAAT
jgi:hypothetical protein